MKYQSLAIAFLATVALLGILPVPTVSEAYSQWVPVAKSCSGCGRSVSLSSRVGDKCPHCGATWSYERESHIGSASSRGTDTAVPSFAHSPTSGRLADFFTMTPEERVKANGIARAEARKARLRMRGY